MNKPLFLLYLNIKDLSNRQQYVNNIVNSVYNYFKYYKFDEKYSSFL